MKQLDVEVSTPANDSQTCNELKIAKRLADLHLATYNSLGSKAGLDQVLAALGIEPSSLT